VESRECSDGRESCENQQAAVDRLPLDEGGANQVNPRQTALGRLLQDRRESAGYSRTRIGELVGIKPGTIEGWELGRVARPPIHDILRLAHFLGIAADEIQLAVFDDAGVAPTPADVPAEQERKKARRRRSEGAVPLLEAAFRLLGWASDEDAGEALDTSPERIRRWRSGADRMEFADYMTLSSIIGVAAAEAMKGDDARIADLAAAAETLGVRSTVS
jgi:transcriptional regulator with XRE-family HTH domain